jgi:hypothetical protein
MIYLFAIRINPAPKVCGLIPLKIAIYITTILSMLYGIINIGLFLANDSNKLSNLLYYVFQSYVVVSTLLVFLTIFLKNKNILLTSIRMHNGYLIASIIFIIIMIFSTISNKFIDENLKRALYILISIQIMFTIFSFYANYVFCSLFVHYEAEIHNRSTNSNITNVKTTPLREVQSSQNLESTNSEVTSAAV